jgi:hypothetical protein
MTLGFAALRVASCSRDFVAEGLLRSPCAKLFLLVS